MKAKLSEVDQWLTWSPGCRTAGSLIQLWRPNAQAVPFGPYPPFSAQAVSQRKMKRIQFHLGVKMLRENCNHTLSGKRFCAMRQDAHNHSQ